MPRPPLRPDRDQFASDEDRESYDTLVARFLPTPDASLDDVQLSPYFSALLNAPTFAAALGRMGTLVPLAESISTAT